MTPERWQQVKGVLHQALELAPDARSAFLDSACSTDHSLRREVESLLSSGDDVRSSFLDSGVARVTLREGTTLGDYEVQSLLGSGGMGEVYRARDLRLGRDVAIKVLPPFFASDRARLRRFEQEARAAAALNHPNILAVHQMGTYEGSPYLVSELLEGETLRGRLKRGAIPLPEAMEYARQIVRGLAAAHDKGIVHRDLKPENLFVTKDGQIKILDFGLAKQTRPESSAPVSLGTEAGAVLGTVGYMSPEQVRGQTADVRSDIFAFGAILYEMLSGKRAFSGESSADVASAILKEDPPRLSKSTSGVPQALEGIVRRCLEKAPEQRFQFAEELSAALRKIEVVPAKGILVSRIWPLLRWRWRLVTSAILLVVVVVGVVASTLYFRSRGAPIDSIAVLPFASTDTGPGVELGDGLTAGLIDSLSQIPNLRVMSRSSVAHYKGQQVDPQKVGRDLNVRAVLSGTLTPRGDGFALDTELVNTTDNSHLWGQQYTTKPTEVLTVQSELARTISAKLRPRLAAEAKAKLGYPGTSNSEAYALYVKGRYAADRWDAQDWKKALDYFQQAVEKDPTYAQAHAGVGEAYVLLGFYRSVPLQEGVQKARAAARRALELDRNLAEGHCAMGGAAYMAWQWQEAEREALRCLELNPNLSFAHQYHAYVLGSLGRTDQAVAETKRALELDPLSFTSNLMLGEDYYYSRDYNRAIEQGLKMTQVEPNQPDLQSDLANSYLMKGEYDKAAEEYEKALALQGKDDQAEALRRAFTRDGLSGLLQAQNQLWSDPKKHDDYCPDQVAGNYALLGDKENAFLWLDKAYADNDKVGCAGNLLPVQVDPFLDNIRSDPRYKAFLRRMGFGP